MGRSPWVVFKLGSTQQLRTQVFPKTTLKCVCVCVCVCTRPKPLQSPLTLSDPIDHRLPGSSVHGIFQARILEWIAIPTSRGSS